MGIILWELLRRDSLENYVGIKSENELRQHIILNSVTFWSRALASLSTELLATNTSTATTGALLCPPSPNFIHRSRPTSFCKSGRFNSNSSPISNKISTSPVSKYGAKHHQQHSAMTMTVTNNNFNELSSEGLSPLNSNNTSVPPPPAFTTSSQIIETLSTCLQFDPDLRSDIKTVGNRLRPLHKGM